MNSQRYRIYSNKGFVIPIVIVVLFMAAIFGAIYNQSIRAQRKLDLMFEHDLRSYYIAQAGFQKFSSRLQSLDNYEARWYTGPNFSGKDSYAYTEEGGKGFYSVFASEVKFNGKFQHVFLLVKGTYQDNVGNQNLTIVRANLSYDPPPPSANGEKAKLFITNKSSINKRRLLEFIKNPNFSKDFQGMPSNINELIEFLGSNKITDIDFDTQKDLLNAIAELSFINQKIRKRLKRKRSAEDLKLSSKLSKALEGAEALNAHSSAHDFAALFHGIDLSSNEVIDGKHFEQEDLQKADVSVILSSLSSLSNHTKISVNDVDNLPFDLKTTGPITALQFSEALNAYVLEKDIKSLPELVDIFNEANVRVSFGGEGVQLSSIVKILSNDPSVSSNEDSPNPNDGTSSSNQNGTSPSSGPDSGEPNTTTGGDDSSTSGGSDNTDGEDGTESEVEKDLNQYLADGKNPPTEFISELIGEDIASGIDWTNEHFENDSPKTYVKIFTQRALQHIRNLNNERKLKNYTSTGEGLTQDEIRAEFKKSMPDISYIQKVGRAIDKVHSSNKYSYYFNAHVMDPYKGGDTRKWRKVTVPQDTWKAELYTKMSHISPKRLPRTNADFLDKFTKSTWGDSESSQLARGTDDRDNFMYLTDKSTGQNIRLVDYLQENI